MNDQSTAVTSASVILRCAECKVLNRVPQQKLMSRPHCGKCKTPLEVPTEPMLVRADSYDDAVANWAETLLVVFTAPMCVNCKIIAPVLKDLARDRAGRLKIVEIDAELDPFLFQKHKVEKTPTFLVYKEGEEVIRVDGLPKEKSEFVTWINNLTGGAGAS